MQFHIGKPKNFWATESAEFAEHRQVYSDLVHVLMSKNHAFSIYEHRPGIQKVRSIGKGEGPVYLYHAEQPEAGEYCLKRGPLPFLWHMNAGGYSGWCSLAQDLDTQVASRTYAPDRAAAIVQSYREKLSSESYGLIPQLDAKLEPQIATLDNFAFYPLQVNNDEVMKLSAFAQFELIRAAGATAEKLQRHVVFKRHPLCISDTVERALQDIGGSKFVHVSTGPTTDLIKAAKAVILTNSSVGVQALILNRPVFSFGLSEYSHMTTRLEAPKDIVRAFSEEIEAPHNIHLNALAYLLDAYLVDMTDEAKIVARLAQHMAESQRQTAYDSATEDRLDSGSAVTLTLMRALEKDSRELLDLQLEMYPDLNGEAKVKAARLLSKLARSGHFVERIIRYTDADVANRCLRYLADRSDNAGQERIARAMIAADPDNINGLHLLSKLLYAKGAKSEGLDYARRAADAKTATAAAIVFYARKLRKDHVASDPDILSLIDRALDKEPQNGRGLWLKAAALQHTGDLEQAEATITEALKIEPNNADYLKLQTLIRATV